MKYLQTIDLWADGMTDALRSGQLKLQVGQWVYCGNKEHKSRYVGCNGRTINAVHWRGDSAKTTAAFIDRVECAKLRRVK